MTQDGTFASQPPQSPNCLQNFEFPFCYFRLLALLTTFVLAIFVIYDLIIKVKFNKRVNRKAGILGLLLLECISFFILNTDRSLIFFYFVMVYLQNLLLCAIFYYYCRKALKLMALERILYWARAVPLLGSAVATGFLIAYLVNYIENPTPIKCQQTRYEGLGIIALILSLMLFCLGVFLTVIIKNKLKDEKYSELSKRKQRAINRFWAFLVVICLSIVVSVTENCLIGANHNCPFFPSSPLGDCFLKLFCKIMEFYLPTLIVYLNFRTRVKAPLPDNPYSCDNIMIQGMLYYSPGDFSDNRY